MRFVSIDFETASPLRSSVCQLGLAIVANGTVQLSRSWLIRPEPSDFKQYFTLIHGIDSRKVQNAPTFSAVWPEVQELIGDATLVAHNASFDMSVLSAALQQHQLKITATKYLCTLQIAKARWRFPSYSLGFLAPSLGIGITHHNAESDAIACAGVLLKAMGELGASTLDEFLTLAGVEPGNLQTNHHIQPPKCEIKHQQKLTIQQYYHGHLHDLQGMTVSTTGQFLNGFTREQFRDLVECAGGVFHRTPRIDTNLFVIGNTELANLAYSRHITTKHETALRYLQRGTGIQIISAHDFMRMVILQRPE